MRRLYLSIIITVISSLFIITWGLDKIVANHAPEQVPTEYLVFQQLISGIDKQLSQLPADKIEQASSQLAQDYQLNLSLDSIDSIALPSELAAQLTLANGLLLASETQPYILKQLSAHPEYVLQLSLPIALQDDQRINIVLTSILYVGICGILLLWLLPLTRRLYLLTQTAAYIGAGNLSARMPSSRFSYINSFENGFNRMADQIEKLVADNKILARSLSHDIRTPMSCLRFGVEAAIDTPNIDKKDQYLARMETELTRMEEMTSAFLEYAGMERQGFQLKYEAVVIKQLLENICADFQSLAEQQQVSLDLQLAPALSNENLTIAIDYHWCYRAVQNLIANAVQYAQTQVLLMASCQQNQLYISVEDDGKGIAEEDLERIFAPFVKLDADRSRELGHFGLGLAISAKVVHWHNGNIKVRNKVTLSGACFTIALPLSNKH